MNKTHHTNELPPLPEPYEINWPQLHSEALGCGVEDRGIRDRYESAEYGWEDGVVKAIERVPEEIYTADQMRQYGQACAQAAIAQRGVKVPDDFMTRFNYQSESELTDYGRGSKSGWDSCRAEVLQLNWDGK